MVCFEVVVINITLIEYSTRDLETYFVTDLEWNICTCYLITFHCRCHPEVIVITKRVNDCLKTPILSERK